MELKKPIKLKDKVFFADGRDGNIEQLEPLKIRLSSGASEFITEEDFANGFERFYLIGKNLIGNKIAAAELEKQISEQRLKCLLEADKLDTLRKQLWTLNERMVPDWKERQNAKKSEAENRTE